MKGKYLLIFLCLLGSLTALGQRRKASEPPIPKKENAAVTSDSIAAEDTTKHVVDDIIPENNDIVCSALIQLMNDAANDFDHTKGKVIESISTGTRWTSMGGIPGAVTSCLIHSTARWQYEGVMFQGNSKEETKAIYEKYKGALEGCLSPKGYEMSSTKNTSSKLDNYPECKYIKNSDKPSKENKHDPRATLNVEYTPGADLYVVTVNVWSK